MKRVLLAAFVLAIALALALALGALLAQHDAPALASEPPAVLLARPEPEKPSVQLSYVESAAAPHRAELPGATQAYGWLVRGDNGQPVSGGLLRLRFEDYAAAAGSAAGEHAQMPARMRGRSATWRDIRVQDDGGWYVDLPGKCWIVGADFTPRQEIRGVRGPQVRTWTTGGLNDLVLEDLPGEVPASAHPLIRTSVPIDAPLERGALEISFAADPGLRVCGVVLDAQSAEPLEGAHVALVSVRGDPPVATAGADGGFEILGIDPRELVPEKGLITFLANTPEHRSEQRQVAWEPGQSVIPAFRIVLNRK